MSNRLTTYFRTRDLVKQHLTYAEDSFSKGNQQKAFRNIIMACREMLIGQNCLVSMAFDSNYRKKRKKAPPKSIADLARG